jgi:hypothetical protein
MNDATQSDPALRARVQELITGAWSTQVVHVAVRLKVFDRLLDGAGSAAALAEATNSNSDAFVRLLRALASIDLVRQIDEDRFELAPAGRLLATDQPGSVRGMALHWGERLWGALAQLDHSVQTGRPWRESGLEGFEHISQDPGQIEMFHQSMADNTAPAASAMIDAYDFGSFRAVMDVGGSYGALLAELLKAYPSLKGKVLDLPGLAKASRAYLERAGVADRGGIQEGSFFDAVPPGADAYLLKSIIHDWDDARAVMILKNCAGAAGPDGRVLVIERIAPEQAGQADYITLRSDILMLTANGGRERTEAQFRSLLARAGLAVRRIVPTVSGFAIIEGAVG